MKTNPVGWFEIYVQDLPRAKTFYETVFATELQSLDAPFSGMEFLAFPMAQDSYGAAGALVRMEATSSGGNGTLVYFACEDCAVEEGRVAGAGGQVEKTKTSIGEYGFISLVRDPDGNRIGLHSMK